MAAVAAPIRSVVAPLSEERRAAALLASYIGNDRHYLHRDEEAEEMRPSMLTAFGIKLRHNEP